METVQVWLTRNRIQLVIYKCCYVLFGNSLSRDLAAAESIGRGAPNTSVFDGTKSSRSKRVGLYSNLTLSNPGLYSNLTLSNIGLYSNLTLSKIGLYSNLTLSNIGLYSNLTLSNPGLYSNLTLSNIGLYSNLTLSNIGPYSNLTLSNRRQETWFVLG
ncbi:hypothetical protein M8J75_003010 [Diaphorina citri]|nr:hypothetical protein M8J75_003010 [Diaphorina citri]